MQEMNEVKEWFHATNSVDLAIMFLMGVSIIMGLLRGFVREAISLVTWVTALVVALLYTETVSTWFTMITLVGFRMLLAFVLIILSILIMGGALSFLISRLIKFTGFGVTDRIIGTVFGMIRGGIVVAACILMLGPTPVSKDPTWMKSTLIPRFQPISLWLKDQLPDWMKQRLPDWVKEEPEDLLKKMQI